MVLLGVVHRLPRGDLSQSLAGTPQLPCDLARTHLGRVEEEVEEEVRRRKGGGEKSVKSKETGGGGVRG